VAGLKIQQATMNIAAVVILYYPDHLVIENIRSYCSFVHTVYIIDNSETALPDMAAAVRQHIPNGVYMADGRNEGISKRLNQACAQARAAGSQYLLTMDQDSRFEPESIQHYFRCFSSFPGSDTVAMYGVQYEQPSWSSAVCNGVPCTRLITSGSLVNLALTDTIGGFNEALFIDMVDFEYGYRSMMKGYRLIQFNNIHLNHSLGSSRFSTTGNNTGKKKRTLHAPIRLYYMVRNYLYIKKRYRQHFPQEIMHNRQAVMNMVKNNLLLNKKRWQVLRYVWQAVRDYKRMKMGKYGG
jgi:rhamnosyltransferase